MSSNFGSTEWGATSPEPEPGRLIIVSGPSGVGKTTVLRELVADCPLPLMISVSATTRPPRAGETPGISYIFLSDEEFQAKRAKNEFLECVEVFGRGHWYGTLRDSVYTSLNQGKWVILEIDVEGAAKVMAAHPDLISIFIHPGSEEELERRLRNRGSEDEAAIQRRMEVARNELAAAKNYHHIVINQSVTQTVTDICQLLQTRENRNHV